MDENDKLVKNGVAYIPTIECSKYCRQIFTKINTCIFKCKYNTKFDKWHPIEKIDDVNKPDNITKITEQLK